MSYVGQRRSRFLHGTIEPFHFKLETRCDTINDAHAFQPCHASRQRQRYGRSFVQGQRPVRVLHTQDRYLVAHPIDHFEHGIGRNIQFGDVLIRFWNVEIIRFQIELRQRAVLAPGDALPFDVQHRGFHATVFQTRVRHDAHEFHRSENLRITLEQRVQIRAGYLRRIDREHGKIVRSQSIGGRERRIFAFATARVDTARTPRVATGKHSSVRIVHGRGVEHRTAGMLGHGRKLFGVACERETHRHITVVKVERMCVDDTRILSLVRHIRHKHVHGVLQWIRQELRGCGLN